MSRKTQTDTCEVTIEGKEKLLSLKREMEFLTRRVAKNPLSTSYYTQIKELLEDLLMLELAQRAAEVTVQYQTRNKIISIQEQDLTSFRLEMEKAKTLKLVAGILSLTGYLNVEDVLDKVTSTIYGPRINRVNDSKDSLLKDLKKILDSYASKLENTIKQKP